jgi:hypothetical protein
MTVFGDKDPEDAWDDGDPPDTKLAILERIVADLRARRDDARHDARRDDALRLVIKLRRQLYGDRLEEVSDALEAL